MKIFLNSSPYRDGRISNPGRFMSFFEDEAWMYYFKYLNSTEQTPLVQAS